jgi:hypothetical protein
MWDSALLVTTTEKISAPALLHPGAKALPEETDERTTVNYGQTVFMAALICLAVSKTTAEPNKAVAPPGKGVHILPPLEYDYPYEGKLTIQRVNTVAELQDACNVTKWLLGCSRPGATSCHIVLVADDVIRKWGWTPELMMRHEMGHCNGWPGDHRGQRPHWEPAGKPRSVKTVKPETPPAPRPGIDAQVMQPVIREIVIDTRTGLPEIFCPSGQVTEPCR